MRGKAKTWAVLAIVSVCICLSAGYSKAVASSAWLEDFTEEMGNVDSWKIVPMTERTSEDITAVDDPKEGKYLLLWDKDDLMNTNKSIFFSRDIDVTDFSGYERIVFKMKGNEKNRAMKLLLFDVEGGWVGYGPFLTNSTEWREMEAILEWPTYSTEWREGVLKLPEGSAKFDLKRVNSIRIIQQDDWGLYSTTEPIGLKDFRLIEPEDSVSSRPKVSSINSNGNMVADGKPFFPLAVYSTIGAGKLSDVGGWFKAIKEAGFNMVHSYTVHSKEEYKNWLDSAQAAGLKVISCLYPHMVEAPLPIEPAAREAEIAKKKAKVKEIIEIVKDHPAMGVYNITDECFQANIPKEQVRLFYDHIKSMDTVHPTLAVESNGPGLPLYRKATDMFGVDIYPVGKEYPADLTSISNFLDRAIKVQIGTPPKPVLWAVLQVFKASEDRRFPTEGEMRAMSFLALTKDVKGLHFFIYNWPNFTLPYSESEPEHWANVSNAINSIHTVFPALLSDKRITGYKVDSDRIHSIAKEVQEGNKKYLYLLAVHPSDGKKLAAPLTVTFKDLPEIKGATVQVLDEDATGGFKLGSIRKLKGSPSGLTDTFGENSVHVYKIELTQRM